MSSPAQIIANQANARHSTGPTTAEGKAVVSQNATKLGLFSASAFVRADERQEFEQFKANYAAELSPVTPLEETLAREIVHASWRLRRCADLETNPPESAAGEDLDRLQTSIDRARAAAQRSFHRSLAELRRLQTERFNWENEALAEQTQSAAPPSRAREQADSPVPLPARPAAAQFAKQTQSRPAAPANVARNAPCPCRSGEKYKRCCGKNAAPVLTTRATAERI